MLIKNKIIIVSGIGPGLGTKLAVQAAKEGAKAVILAARTQTKIDLAEEAVNALDNQCQVLKLATDITDKNQCEQLVSEAIKNFGNIDILFNSAFMHGNFESIESADLNSWKQVINTNLIGTMQMTQAVIPQMKAQKNGAIVMVNTMSVRKPFIGECGYSASKAALGSATKFLALELGQYGIRANSAHMGWMWGVPVQSYISHTSQQNDVSEQSLIDEVAKKIPIGRIPTDDECAKAALFLGSDYASAVNGAILDVNGGEFLPT